MEIYITVYYICYIHHNIPQVQRKSDKLFSVEGASRMSQVALYFFQGETGESPEQPNAFKLPSSQKTTFNTFMKYFPAPTKERLHFRFKEQDSTHGYVWRVFILVFFYCFTEFFPRSSIFILRMYPRPTSFSQYILGSFLQKSRG